MRSRTSRNSAAAPLSTEFRSCDFFQLGMRYGDHDVSLLVSVLNVLESFRDPLQGITSVDDRPELPSRDELCDETHSLQVVDSHPALDLLSTGDGGPQDPNDVGQLHDV